ncbi:MAG: PA14 domain-containing protein [Planctomycetota bacterium]|nr:PA14 domain-containing protein [Planctomycetota bacterium]MDA1141771.1 PA14 domain-containing protein [Planctomycetota bacterium]
MKAYTPGSKQGFTIIELLVVSVIIVVLASLIVPALQRMQSGAISAQCGSKARTIAQATLTYAAEWKGYTNIDEHYYVKLLGYKLSSEFVDSSGNPDPNGADSVLAANVKDFLCPADGSGALNSHGYRSSYRIMGSFVGGNILKITSPKAQTAVVYENAKRHTRSTGDADLVRMYAFQDLHFSAGFPGGFLPGLTVSAWDNLGVYTQVSGPVLTYAAAPTWESMWAGDMNLAYADFQSMFASLIANRRFSTRFDGYITFPENGTYVFEGTWDNNLWIWVDVDRDNVADIPEVRQQPNSQVAFNLLTVTVQKETNYRFVVTHDNNNGGGSFLSLKWSSLPQVTKDFIPSKYLLHIDE